MVIHESIPISYINSSIFYVLSKKSALCSNNNDYFAWIISFFKRKKNMGNGSGSGFFSCGNHNQNDLIDLIFVQQLINSSVNNDLSNFNDKFSSSSNEKEIKIERIKKEIMELLDK